MKFPHFRCVSKLGGAGKSRDNESGNEILSETLSWTGYVPENSDSKQKFKKIKSLEIFIPSFSRNGQEKVRNDDVLDSRFLSFFIFRMIFMPRNNSKMATRRHVIKIHKWIFAFPISSGTMINLQSPESTVIGSVCSPFLQHKRSCRSLCNADSGMKSGLSL